MRTWNLLLLLLQTGCASEITRDLPRRSATVVTLPDEPAYVLGSLDTDDPHQQWQALTGVWFLDPSTVVFADWENRVVAVDVDGVGKWIFDGNDVRYNLGGSGTITIGAEDGQVLVYGAPRFLVLSANGEVVREERIALPVSRKGERILAGPVAVSADKVVFSESAWRPPLQQILHVADTREGKSFVLTDLPHRIWDDDRDKPAGGRNRYLSVSARHGLIVYAARGDSTVTIRDVRTSDSLTLRMDFAVYRQMIDAESRVWVSNYDADGTKAGPPTASVFTREGDHLFDYWGFWPIDAMGSRIVIPRGSEVDRSLLEIHIFELPETLPD